MCAFLYYSAAEQEADGRETQQAPQKNKQNAKKYNWKMQKTLRVPPPKRGTRSGAGTAEESDKVAGFGDRDGKTAGRQGTVQGCSEAAEEGSER